MRTSTTWHVRRLRATRVTTPLSRNGASTPTGNRPLLRAGWSLDDRCNEILREICCWRETPILSCPEGVPSEHLQVDIRRQMGYKAGVANSCCHPSFKNIFDFTWEKNYLGSDQSASSSSSRRRQISLLVDQRRCISKCTRVRALSYLRSITSCS